MILEKRISVIEKIKKNGFINYFFQNFKKFSTQIQECLQQWKDITLSDHKFRWKILDDCIIFLLEETNQLYFNLNDTKFISLYQNFPLENSDICRTVMEIGFETFFIRNYSTSISIYTVSHFIAITKEDYKQSWIIDSNKNIIYFKFRSLCGEGSVKKTYLGWNITYQKPIAVYQINVSLNKIEQKRCVNEKRIAQLVKSPYLLNIHYSFTQKENNKAYMISDFMKYSIKTMMDMNYPWSIYEIKIFSKNILTGLKILHSMNIIHRDIKPSNILYDDENKIYRLIDFGVATKYNISNKVETINLQLDHLSLVGTVGYIAPEMYKSIYNLNNQSSYSFQVDIFSFGITLLEMICNQRAFTKDLSNLSNIIHSELYIQEQNFKDIIKKDSEFLLEFQNNLKSFPFPKKIQKLQSEIQSKMDLLNQFLICESEEKESYISELLDKNKSINFCCKKLKSETNLDLLDKNTSDEYTLISEIQSLEQFASKLTSFKKKSLDQILDDVFVYPILFNLSNYEYPSLLNDVKDELLIDFLKKCLHKDPSLRSSIDDLLNHPWLLNEDL